MWRKIEERHRREARYPPPAVIGPNPLIENYKAHTAALKRAEEESLRTKLARCSTMAETIIVAVCHEFNLTKAELLASGRKYALPRHVAMHIMSKHSQRNTRGVARVFKKDHTCVILANKKVPQLVANDNELASRVRAIETYLAA